MRILTYRFKVNLKKKKKIKTSKCNILAITIVFKDNIQKNTVLKSYFYCITNKLKY